MESLARYNFDFFRVGFSLPKAKSISKKGKQVLATSAVAHSVEFSDFNSVTFIIEKRGFAKLRAVLPHDQEEVFDGQVSLLIQLVVGQQLTGQHVDVVTSGDFRVSDVDHGPNKHVT